MQLGAHYWSCNCRHYALGASTPKQAKTRPKNTGEVTKISDNTCHTRCSKLGNGKNEKSRYKLKIVQEILRISEGRKEPDDKGKSFSRRKETETYTQHAQKCSLRNAWETEVKKSSQQSSSEQRWWRARVSCLQQIRFTSQKKRMRILLSLSNALYTYSIYL